MPLRRHRPSQALARKQKNPRKRIVLERFTTPKKLRMRRRFENSKEVRELSQIKDQPPFFVGLMNAVAWPLVVLLLAYAAFRAISFNQVRELFGAARPLIRKVSFGGVAVEFNFEGLRERGIQTKNSFNDLVSRADKEYQLVAAQQEINSHLTNVMRHALPRVLEAKGLAKHPPDLRATVHVSDILFEHYFYQLTDYFPDNAAGGPAGRRFSERFGMIGRSWRLGTSSGRGNAVASPDNELCAEVGDGMKG